MGLFPALGKTRVSNPTLPTSVVVLAPRQLLGGPYVTQADGFLVWLEVQCGCHERQAEG